ncbi:MULTISPECIES: hypothetical protein [Burkholderia]|uniref:hypothetical protein n=1 Tax=Burkholderia TaxID=32008 RepID=UPI0007559FB8|nr:MULTISPECIES: hypothetical protein [Burkholderia]AOJ69180.1 hypothetical protein WS78_10735 [Burkholderia savannae]KVG39819.1 hypothetical protein WS77_19285 [Burkholderia sp. MSMB0265]KVG85770.1 hypothetical protein WS81_31390 [Burkholderia sp. MSMB2040]KVG92215.1 hypothetical protein WS82_12260 [Burkholderia sp. MSMB2041]KVG95707.1 hypothetical protein WS83_03975 [Burkholderia sp. MSMB2042]
MGNLFSKTFASQDSGSTVKSSAGAFDMMFSKINGEKAQRYASYLGESAPTGEGPNGVITFGQLAPLQQRYEAKYAADQEAAAAKARQDALDNDPAVKSAREAAGQAQANAEAQAAAAKQAGIDAADASVNATNMAANGVAQRAAVAEQTSAQATDAAASVDTNANSQGEGSNDPRRRYIGAAMSSSNAAVSRGGAGISIS